MSWTAIHLTKYISNPNSVAYIFFKPYIVISEQGNTLTSPISSSSSSSEVTSSVVPCWKINKQKLNYESINQLAWVE